ncbi:AbrB/MazE/SpoVT family DNA-binding domain-containing protein [Enterococcus faecalis]
MEIKERKLRKVGNSVVMTLSKEFLESIGATATDTVYVDEEKLKDIMSEHQKKLQQMMENSKQKHNELYKELVTK